VSQKSSVISTKYVVVRTPVEEKGDHREYREELRIDFWFTCAYCTISEAEARGIGFEIDHYEPESSRPELATVYSNLMYACEHCNSTKWMTCPPPKARADGRRFFKADEDDASDHFALADDDSILGTTAVGDFTVKMLELNRGALVRLREIRRRIAEGAEEIAFGLRALKGIRIDAMSAQQKLRFGFAKHEMESDSLKIDEVLMGLCHSELLDTDDDKEEHSQQRRAHLQAWRVQYPDPWWPKRKGRKSST
jgi:uncharacterized protein (TIGR02646 family)